MVVDAQTLWCAYVHVCARVHGCACVCVCAWCCWCWNWLTILFSMIYVHLIYLKPWGCWVSSCTIHYSVKCSLHSAVELNVPSARTAWPVHSAECWVYNDSTTNAGPWTMEAQHCTHKHTNTQTHKHTNTHTWHKHEHMKTAHNTHNTHNTMARIFSVASMLSIKWRFPG